MCMCLSVCLCVSLFINHREVIASRVMDIEEIDLNQNNGTKAKV